ncbi:hypothetical protein FB570_119116 [Streptomyces sp. T12]|uniref:hypothetical protein n=1 Tax=Streptomyces sp. T12 TaxID=477697 RepID=UPI0011ACC930|nr:hypothetical protein [Streptomyces sp. T12]TWD13189.1 hypothetical protein FB570_119116 [Streptomyces sp. T12]
MSNDSQNKEGQLIKEEQQKKRSRLSYAVRRLLRKGITGILLLDKFITVIQFILDYLG